MIKTTYLKIFTVYFILFVLLGYVTADEKKTQIVYAESLLEKEEVINSMKMVNDYWIDHHLDPGSNDWARSTYFEGNMAMYRVYPQEKYYEYAVKWGQKNNWGLLGGNTTRFADNQCAGQTYIELYQYSGNESWVINILNSAQQMVNSTTYGDWTWVDAIHMSMPVFAKLGAIKNDTRYFDKMYQLYNHTKRSIGGKGLYAGNEYYQGDYLWWRDSNYDYPRVNANNKQIFWSRGNGWVFAAHVRVLDVLPINDPHYEEYMQTFKDMAETLKRIQRPDGFWYSNLGDENDCPGPEVSGTAFFTYGLAYGINKGLLDREEYLPVAVKAWEAMVNTALHADGFLGYVQKQGLAPATTNYSTTEDFGVGAFLLAGSEMLELADGPMPEIPMKIETTITVGNLVNATSLKSGEPLDVKISVKNENCDDKWVSLVVVLYDSKGLLKKIVLDNQKIVAQNERNLNAGFILPDPIDGYYLKVFVLDSLDHVRPLESIVYMQ